MVGYKNLFSEQRIMLNKQSNRLLSLDAFRGLTIVAMIIVNSNLGQNIYPWIDHSPWNGCTAADLVFPFFIFIMGISLTFSLSNESQKNKGPTDLFPKIVRRTIIIFFLGFLLNLIGNEFVFSTVRIMGVLQRIALCYFFDAMLFITTRARAQVIIAALLLIGYWLAMTFIPVPGYGADNLSPEGNLAGYIDRSILFASLL